MLDNRHFIARRAAQYFKVGFPMMLLTVVIAAGYLVLRFPPA